MRPPTEGRNLFHGQEWNPYVQYPLPRASDLIADAPAVKFTDSSATKSLIDMDDGSSSSGSMGSNAFNRPSPDQPHTPTPHDALKSLMGSTRAYEKLNRVSDNTAQMFKDRTNRENLLRQSTRNWKPGDIYAPHDLSPQEMVKWKQPKQPSKDIIDMLGLNPLDHYRVRGSFVCILRLISRS